MTLDVCNPCLKDLTKDRCRTDLVPPKFTENGFELLVPKDEIDLRYQDLSTQRLTTVPGPRVHTHKGVGLENKWTVSSSTLCVRKGVT